MMPVESGKPAGPVPEDVAKALRLMRTALDRPLPMAEILDHCGVPARTLGAHFRMFLGLPPARYLRRLRLAAVREALLAGAAGTTVTEVARRFQLNHPGRFAEDYRARFGETPSNTLRRARARARAGATARAASGGAVASPQIASREKPSVAVLPAAVPAGEPALRRQAEALAEAIAAGLASVRALAVSLAAPARAAARDPQALAREMGARYLLAGRLVREGDRLRVVLRLAEAATGHQVWGDCFDGEAGQPLALHDRVVRGVRDGLLPGIRGAEIERAQRLAPRDLDAHGLALRALPLLHASTPDGTGRALELLDRASGIDPDYGLAAALAAWGQGQLVIYNGAADPAAARDRSRRLALRAALLDDGDPLALTARCAVHMMLGELDLSEALACRALARDPCCGWAWGRSGWLHAYRGNPGVAIAHFRRALRFEPETARANILAGIGSAHFEAGRYAAAASWIGRAMRAQPGITWANRSLSVSYARIGERRKALESVAALRRSHPGLTVGQVVAAVPFRPGFLERLGNGLGALGLPA